MLSNNVDSSDPILEIRDELIALLERFVHLIASHAAIDLQETPKVRWFTENQEHTKCDISFKQYFTNFARQARMSHEPL
jgi:hypothetical protein